MKVEANKWISLKYTLIVEGEVIETVTEENPLQFLFGVGQLLPKFEENVADKSVGDKFDFKLSATEGYGEIDPNAVVELPKELFKVEGKVEEGLLEIGRVLPMQDSAGNRLNGVVEKVSEESVTMNFNHPLAGEELHFQGEVVAIREATDKEIMQGLYGEGASDCGSEGGCAGCTGC